MAKKYFLIIFSLLFFISIDVFASDYTDENLQEVLANANLRASPTTDAEILAVLPGGFVVSVSETAGKSNDWYHVIGSNGDYASGFVHSSLLTDTTRSYQMKEVKNKYHLIKSFQPKENNDYIYPQSHARLYTLDGTFITNLPRISDSSAITDAMYIAPGDLANDFPFYSLTSYSGGAHCCFKYRFIAKTPLFEKVIDFPFRIEDQRFVIDKKLWQIDVWDETYTYWQYGYAGSPIPKVTLDLTEDGFKTSRDSMATSPPTKSELNEKIKSQPKILADGHGIAELTGTMLHYIYSGNLTTAKIFLNAVWAKSLRVENDQGGIWDRDQYLHALTALVKSSPFYEAWMLRE